MQQCIAVIKGVIGGVPRETLERNQSKWNLTLVELAAVNAALTNAYQLQHAQVACANRQPSQGGQPPQGEAQPQGNKFFTMYYHVLPCLMPVVLPPLLCY